MIRNNGILVLSLNNSWKFRVIQTRKSILRNMRKTGIEKHSAFYEGKLFLGEGALWPRRIFPAMCIWRRGLAILAGPRLWKHEGEGFKFPECSHGQKFSRVHSLCGARDFAVYYIDNGEKKKKKKLIIIIIITRQ